MEKIYLNKSTCVTILKESLQFFILKGGDERIDDIIVNYFSFYNKNL